ncbi:MAG: hypothetical protein PVI26_13285 [Chitinispirillia bacterium]|jgi:hypothetical protein
MNKKQKAVLVIWLLCIFLLLLQAPRHMTDIFESGKIKRDHGSYSLLYPRPFDRGVFYDIHSNVPFLPVLMVTCIGGGLIFIFRNKKESEN